MRTKVIKQFTHKETNRKNYFVSFCDIRQYCRSNKLIDVNYFQLLIPCHDLFVMHINLTNNAHRNRILSLDCQFHFLFIISKYQRTINVFQYFTFKLINISPSTNCTAMKAIDHLTDYYLSKPSSSASLPPANDFPYVQMTPQNFPCLRLLSRLLL